jgi:pimeloyl-ACP methyl ester carboxylesterase
MSRSPKPIVFKEGTIPVTGGVIHYVSGGEGERTLVLLHKLGGWAAEWRWVMQILSTRMRIVALDLTGHGGSKMDGQPPFIVTQEELAAHVMSALDTMGEKRIAIAGSSIGGCVGAVCAAFWPERVTSFITVGSLFAEGIERTNLQADAEKGIANGFFDVDENPMPRDPSYMERVFGMSNPAHMEEMTLSRRAAGRWIAPCSRGVALYDYFSILPRIHAPILIASGAKGNYGRFAADAIPLMKDARYEPIEGASAFPHQDKPEQTAVAVMSFLGV